MVSMLNAWSPLSNFQDYVNVTNITLSNYTFAYNSITNLNTFAVPQYFYFNTTVNGTLHNSTFDNIAIYAYSKSGGYLGNVTAFPYPVGDGGLLIDDQASNATYGNVSYSFITIFFNQKHTQNTYLSSYESSHVVQYGNNQPFFLNSGLVIYKTPAFQNFATSNFTYIVPNGVVKGAYVDIGGELTNPYLLVSSLAANKLADNVSIWEGQPDSNGNSYMINYSTSTNTYSLYNNGQDGSQTLTTSSSSAVSEYIMQSGVAPSMYQYLNNNLGAYSQQPNLYGFNQINIFNYTENVKGYQCYFLCGSPTILGKSYKILMNFSAIYPANNYYHGTYYLIPIYSSSNYIVQNAIRSGYTPVPFCTNTGWCGDYKYRIQVNITNFTYTQQTFAAPTQNGNSIDYSVPAIWLKLTLPHYTGMGNSCQYVYMDAYNSSSKLDDGAIPFSVLSYYNGTTTCTYPNATFAVMLTDAKGTVPTSFYVYFDSSSNVTGYNTNFGNLSIAYKNGIPGNFPSYDVIVNLTSPLTTQSYLSLGGVLFNESTKHVTQASACKSTCATLKESLNSTFAETQFLFIYNANLKYLNIGNNNCGSGDALIGQDITADSSYPNCGSGIGQGGWVESNLTTYNQEGIYWNNYGVSFNSIGTEIILIKPYTDRYYTGSVELNNTASNICISCNDTVPIPTGSVQNPFTNSSSLLTINNSRTNLNATLNNLKLSSTTTLWGMKVPAYVSAILLIIAILIILGIAVSYVELFLGIILLIVLGILNKDILALGVILLFIYIIYEVVERIRYKGD